MIELPRYEDLLYVVHTESCPVCQEKKYCHDAAVILSAMSREESAVLSAHVFEIDEKKGYGHLMDADTFRPQWLSPIEAGMAMHGLIPADDPRWGDSDHHLIKCVIHPDNPYEFKYAHHLETLSSWGGDYFIYHRGSRMSNEQTADLMAREWCLWQCLGPSFIRPVEEGETMEDLVRKMEEQLQRQRDHGTIMLLFTEQDGRPTEADIQLAIALTEAERAERLATDGSRC